MTTTSDRSPTGAEGRYCRGCGYDLRESEGRCPECGRGFDSARVGSYFASRNAFARRRLMRRVAAALLVLVLPGTLGGWGLWSLYRGWEEEQSHLSALVAPTMAARAAVVGQQRQLVYGSARMETRYALVRRILPQGMRFITERATSIDLTCTETRGERVGAADLERFVGLSRLKVVKISAAMMRPRALRPLCELRQLETVVLGERRGRWAFLPIGDAHVADLVGARNLRTLDLSNYAATDDALEHVGKIPSLETLVLRQNRIDGSGLRHLVGLTRLRKLDLAQTEVTSSALAHLRALPSLKELDLSDTPIADESVEHLIKLTTVKELRVDRTWITAEGVRRLRQGLPSARIPHDVERVIKLID